MDVRMRLATADDFEIFNQMYINFFVDDGGRLIDAMQEEKYKDMLEIESIYLATLNEEVIGFATLYAYEGEGCQIDSIFVKEKNKGVGAKFYKLLEKEIRDSNINRIFVHVFDERPEHFWYRMGFRSVNGTEEFDKYLNP